MADSCNALTLTCCGCCEGVSQVTPQTIQNRPGLSAIVYRVGTHAQFFETLQARIALSGQPSLRALRTRDSDDFTIALLDAFSVMADVLTFYSERIANEAYLRTATERLSVRELANLVGYRMSPGVAASAYLAFTIDPSAGAFGTALTAAVNAQVLPELVPSIIVPVGTRVQSIPGPGEKPQAFETIQQIMARPEWNAMLPRPLQTQQVGTDTTAIILSGAISNLKHGDQLLILPGNQIKQAKSASVLSVTVATDGKSTEVDLNGWTPPPPVGYRPATFKDDPAQSGMPLTQGLLSDLQAKADIPSAAVMLADPSLWFSASDIVAAAQANQWPLDELAATVEQQVAAQIAAKDSISVFRQQASPFGYNSPNYFSLQPALRFSTTFPEAGSPPQVTVPAAYPYFLHWDPDPSLSPPDSGFTLDQWGNNLLYLDSLYPQIVPGSYVVLIADGTGKTLFATVMSNTPVSHSQFSVSGRVSQLAIQPAAGAPALSNFGLRNTSILCQSEQLPLAQVPINALVGDPKNSTDVITLDAAYLGLLPGQSIILSGQTVVVNAQGTQIPGPVAAEARTLQQVQLVRGFTVITLDKSLDNLYQRSTVQINANVAPATHGQTIVELLGSGDGTQSFQTFTLHQSPLTYVQASTPSGSTSTLQVMVDGVLWTEVPFFYGHGPTEHIYVTSQDDSGVTTVTFGDGVTGSRLPTGSANVQAVYRYGIGTQGLVRPNQLSQLLSRPLGVRGVNNPLAASGAADAEDLNSGRERATLTIMTLDRVVSLEDYQDFAKAFVGISKALATWTWNGQQRIVVLSVAGANGPIAPTDPVLTTLPQAISQFSEPRVSLVLFPYTPIYFNLNASVTIAADLQVSDVQAAIVSALRTAFGFAARDFGQPVFQSEVIAVIQDVTGVIDLSLTIYSSDDPTQTPQTQIAAKVPQPGGRNQIFAAQLLTLDPGTLGITVIQ